MKIMGVVEEVLGGKVENNVASFEDGESALAFMRYLTQEGLEGKIVGVKIEFNIPHPQ